MTPAEIPFLSASALAAAIRAGEVSAAEAVDAYLDRIDAVGDKLNAYITVCADEARGRRKATGRRSGQRELSRSPARRPGRHQGPDPHGRGTNHRCLKDPCGVCARSGCNRGLPAEGSRSGHHRQDQHERVCTGRPDQQLVWRGAKSLGHRTKPRHVQHRQRFGDGRVPLRHLAG